MIGTDMRSAFKPVDAIVLSGVSPGTKSHHNQHTIAFSSHDSVTIVTATPLF